MTLAAVAGRRFDFALLAHALGCAEDDLLPLIKEFVAAQLVTEESGDRFAFRHALVRQAIDELLARERRALHRAIADALEASHTTPARREARLADLAHHCYEAGAGNGRWSIRGVPGTRPGAARAGCRDCVPTDAGVGRTRGGNTASGDLPRAGSGAGDARRVRPRARGLRARPG